MIGRLRGKLLTKQPPWLLVDVGGVGYELEAPMSTVFELPDVGTEVTLLTHLVVREDAHVLYGFLTEGERRLFRDLLKVSGVGARIALAILSGVSPEGFARCVREQDVAALVRVPGIGRKTAERLLVEMRDRVGKPDEGPRGPAATPASSSDEAFSALVALGYKPAEVTRMLSKVEGEGLSTEDLIRQVLRSLG